PRPLGGRDRRGAGRAPRHREIADASSARGPEGRVGAMNDDELIERLQNTLRDEASTVTSPPDAWEQFNQGNVTVLRPNRRVWLGVPAGVLATAAAIVLLVALVGHGSSAEKSTQ